MQLNKTGAETRIGSFSQLMIRMKWTIAADFDLAAVFEDKRGKNGIVYFGDMGDLNAYPFMQLSSDEGVDDEAGENLETMRITRMDTMKYIWILCWDYGKVKEGKPARFRESDIILVIIDDRGKKYDVTLDTGDLGNVAVIATIDNSDTDSTRLVNTSKSGTLKGLSNLKDLLNIINV